MNDHKIGNYDGYLTMLFQPDELAVHDYRKTGKRKTLLEPEKRLIFAVLADAVVCFQRFVNATSRKQKRLHQEAANWIFKPGDHGIFSFESVCEICGFDPKFLRTGLIKWREDNKLSGVSQKANRQANLHASRRENRVSTLMGGATLWRRR